MTEEELIEAMDTLRKELRVARATARVAQLALNAMKGQRLLQLRVLNPKQTLSEIRSQIHIELQDPQAPLGSQWLLWHECVVTEERLANEMAAMRDSYWRVRRLEYNT